MWFFGTRASTVTSWGWSVWFSCLPSIGPHCQRSRTGGAALFAAPPVLSLVALFHHASRARVPPPPGRHAVLAGPQLLDPRALVRLPAGLVRPGRYRSDPPVLGGLPR